MRLREEWRQARRDLREHWCGFEDGEDDRGVKVEGDEGKDVESTFVAIERLVNEMVPL